MILIRLLSLSFSFMFLISFWMKAFGFKPFVKSIEGFSIVPRKYSSISAWTIVCLEAVLAWGFALAGAWRPLFIVAALTLSGFSMALYYAHRNRAEVECSCFGAKGVKTNLPFALARNIVLIALCVIGVAFSPVRFTLEMPFYYPEFVTEAALAYALFRYWTRFARSLN